MRGRWAVFLLALAASALLAIGFGIGVTRATGATPQAPRLRTVSAGALAAAGVTLAPPEQPPYCDAERTAAARRWISAGMAGCAITDREAEAALLPELQSTVTEAVLARVTGPAVAGVAEGELVWLVVVRSNPQLATSECGPPRANGPVCAARRPGQVPAQEIVLVDGSSGEVLKTLPVSG
ncbi:MAG TPA: hypothetical protein VOB72_17585 [Candidatus Dormibacteraeota bacterium]|nr:hypothetical protein [Candidatus Dormibacteraeota bacterium]